MREIRLLGLNRLSEQQVLIQLQTKVGGYFREEDLRQDYQNQWETGEFWWIEPPRVEPLQDGVRITIQFFEKDKILDVRLQGVVRLDRKNILENARTQRGKLYWEIDVNYDERDIENQYKERGYPFVEVRSESVYVEEKSGRIVQFVVNEGPQVSVVDVEFRGNSSFSDKELRRVMETKRRSWFFGFPTPGKFDEETFLEDVRRLETFYRSKGFFDVVVFPEEFSFNRKRNRLVLRIRIEERVRYRIRDVNVSIEGNKVFPEDLLKRRVTLKRDDYFDGPELRESLNSIENLYRERAYIEARANVSQVVGLRENVVSLAIDVTEGEKFFVEGIEIRGNTQTKDKVIRRELPFYPGEEIKFSKIEAARSNLFRLRYFDNLRFSFEDGSNPNQKNVVVDVAEGSTGRFVFGFGVVTGRGIVGNIQLNKLNFDLFDTPESFWDLPDSFVGAGQSFRIQASPGNELSRYVVEFVEPHVADTDVSLSLEFAIIDNILDQFRDDRQQFTIGLGKRLTQNLTARINYRFEVVEIRDIDEDAAPDIFRVEGRTRVSSSTLFLDYDRQVYRAVLGPVDGWSVGGAYTVAGGPLGAEVDLSKASANYRYYKTIHASLDGEKRRHILQFRTRFDWAEENRNTPEVPIFERYFLGGVGTLRGFRFRGVGPMFNRDPVGGVLRHYGAVQYTFPIFEETVRGAVYTDFGNLVSEVDDIKLDDYRMSVGTGILINVGLLGQIIPISVFYSEPFRSEEGDRKQRFQFEIGFGF